MTGIIQQKQQRNKPVTMSKVIKPKKKREKLAFIEQNLFEEVCSYVACGMSLANIAKLPGMPNPFSVIRKMCENDINKQLYLHAREMGVLAFAEDLLTIADNTKGNVDRDRLRIDARKFLMSKMNRALFGDNVQVEGNPNKPIVIKWQGDGPMVQGDSAKVIDATVNTNVIEHEAKNK